MSFDSSSRALPCSVSITSKGTRLIIPSGTTVRCAKFLATAAMPVGKISLKTAMLSGIDALSGRLRTVVSNCRELLLGKWLRNHSALVAGNPYHREFRGGKPVLQQHGRRVEAVLHLAQRNDWLRLARLTPSAVLGILSTCSAQEPQRLPQRHFVLSADG